MKAEKMCHFLSASKGNVHLCRQAYVYLANQDPICYIESGGMKYASDFFQIPSECMGTMKTLYVTDLDGTLLRPDETLSNFTVRTINSFVEQGMLFSYATARSIITASRVTAGLSTHFPVILYNGAFIRRPDTGELLASNFFGPEFRELLGDLLAHEVYPIVYSLTDGQERYRYWAEKSTPGMTLFNNSRRGDPRETPVHSAQALYEGSPFCMTCIDETQKLAPLYERYKHRFHCILHHDIYSGNQWLEFLPKSSSKANAVRQLKDLLGCDRLVVFGDGKNDMDMFRMADEAYAMENAVVELKAIATEVIGSNEADGVAKWLLAHWKSGYFDT